MVRPYVRAVIATGPHGDSFAIARSAKGRCEAAGGFIACTTRWRDVGPMSVAW
jgi:hypothetical protein